MSYENISTTYPIAREEHFCSWCYEKINKGEKYVYDFAKCDGDIQVLKFHNECWEALKKSNFYDEYMPNERLKRGEIYSDED